MTPAEQPTGLHIDHAYQHEIGIMWNAVASPHTGYYIAQNGVTIGYANADATTFTDTGLTPGANYSYTVSAIGPAGAGACSAGTWIQTPTSGTEGESRPTITVFASQPYGIYNDSRDISVEVFRTGDRLGPLTVVYGLSEHRGVTGADGPTIAPSLWDFTGEVADPGSPGNYEVTIQTGCGEATIALDPTAAASASEIHDIDVAALLAGPTEYVLEPLPATGPSTREASTQNAKAKWVVKRDHTEPYARAEMLAEDASWADLAAMVGLSAGEACRWVRDGDSGMVGSYANPSVDGEYQIPNTIYLSAGGGMTGAPQGGTRELEEAVFRCQALELGLAFDVYGTTVSPVEVVDDTGDVVRNNLPNLREWKRGEGMGCDPTESVWSDYPYDAAMGDMRKLEARLGLRVAEAGYRIAFAQSAPAVALGCPSIPAAIGAPDAAIWVYVGHGQFNNGGDDRLDSDQTQYWDKSYLMPKGGEKDVYEQKARFNLQHKLAAVWVSACKSVKGPWQDLVSEFGETVMYNTEPHNIDPFTLGAVVTYGGAAPKPSEIPLVDRTTL